MPSAAIRSSAKSLEQGDEGQRRPRGPRAAAASWSVWPSRSAALKAAELAAKLQAAESIARQARPSQHDAEKAENANERRRARGTGQSPGVESGQGQQGDESPSEGGEGRDGEGDSRFRALGQPAARQAEEVRTVEDILKQARVGREPGRSGPRPRLGGGGRGEFAQRDRRRRWTGPPRPCRPASASGPIAKSRDSAKRLDALANQIEAARHGFTEPKLEALIAAEKTGGRTAKGSSRCPSPTRRRGTKSKRRWATCAARSARCAGTDRNLGKEANALADAIEGGYFGPGRLAAIVRGRDTTNRRSSMRRPCSAWHRALQVRIQAMILKDAILDRDQPVPEQYRKHVEEYYPHAVGGLEITPCRRFNGCLRISIAVYLGLLAGCAAGALACAAVGHVAAGAEPGAAGSAGDRVEPADPDAVEPRRIAAKSARRRGPREIVFLVDCSKSMGLNRPGNRLEQVKEALRQCNVATRSSVRPSVFRFGRQTLGGVGHRGTPRRRRRHAAAGCLAAAAGAVRRRSAGGRGDLLRRAHDGNRRLPGGGGELSQERKMPLHVFPVQRPGHDGRRGDSGIGGSAVRSAGQPRARPRADRRLRICRVGGRKSASGRRPIRGPGRSPSLPSRFAGAPETLRSDDRARPVGRRTWSSKCRRWPARPSTENNQVPFRIASQIKKLRVIYMEATLGDEYHWLRDALVEDPTIECLPMEVQAQFINNQRLQRVGDPGRGYPRDAGRVVSLRRGDLQRHQPERIHPGATRLDRRSRGPPRRRVRHGRRQHQFRRGRMGSNGLGPVDSRQDERRSAQFVRPRVHQRRIPGARSADGRAASDLAARGRSAAEHRDSQWHAAILRHESRSIA